MNISIVKDYICFCVIPIEENELYFLRCDGFFESIGLIGGCRSLLCAYIKYCYPNNSLSLIKQLWSYLQYNHFVFFHLTDMTEVFKGRTFENIMLYSGKNKEKKVRHCKDACNSITIQTAMVNIYSVFTNNTCLHNDEVKK